MTTQPAPTLQHRLVQDIPANPAPDAASAQHFPVRHIRELLLDPEPKRAMQKVAAFLNVYTQTSLRSALQSLLAAPDVLREIAARSYLHGNGFCKIVLAQDDRLKLRLHLWLPGAPAEEYIHDHRWHFASTIVHGRQESEIWQEAIQPEATEFAEILYFAKEGDSPPFQIHNGKTKLLCVRKSVRTAGEAYVMPPGVLHRTVSSGNSLTATLMCQAAPARRWNRLIPFTAITPDITQRYLSTSELHTLIHQVLLVLQPH